MIITAIIGYALVALCMILGCAGLYWVGIGKTWDGAELAGPKASAYMATSFAFLLLAFGLAAITEMLT